MKTVQLKNAKTTVTAMENVLMVSVNASILSSVMPAKILYALTFAQIMEDAKKQDVNVTKVLPGIFYLNF